MITILWSGIARAHKTGAIVTATPELPVEVQQFDDDVGTDDPIGDLRLDAMALHIGKNSLILSGGAKATLLVVPLAEQTGEEE